MKIYEHENGSIEIDTGKSGFDKLVICPQYQIGETFEDKAVKIYLALMKEEY